MRCGVFTDGLAHLSLANAAAWCASRNAGDLELLLRDPRARSRLLRSVEQAGCRLSALNASGNPLHPDPVISGAHDKALRRALRLARLLEIETVVAMSGCPGGPGGGLWPVFAGGAWLPDMEGLWEWQWREQISPYWRELSQWARRETPAVNICLELHPGTSIYNPATFLLLREVTGENVLVNLDPSHFWWQAIDPVQAITSLSGCIGFAHAKDTTLHPDRVSVNGLLDYLWPSDQPAARPWHFSAVGSGHDHAVWRQLIAALHRAGYQGVLSIEHEDPLLSAEDGISASLAALADVL